MVAGERAWPREARERPQRAREGRGAEATSGEAARGLGTGERGSAARPAAGELGSAFPRGSSSTLLLLSWVSLLLLLL